MIYWHLYNVAQSINIILIFNNKIIIRFFVQFWLMIYLVSNIILTYCQHQLVHIFRRYGCIRLVIHSDKYFQFKKFFLKKCICTLIEADLNLYYHWNKKNKCMKYWKISLKQLYNEHKYFNYILLEKYTQSQSFIWLKF